MQFDIEHDWQENMAIPRAKLGDRAKTHLLILLCAIWICIGLISHTPWKPFESNAISIIQGLLNSNSWLAPTAASHLGMDNPPLYFWVATLFAKIFSPLLSIHDAARLSSGLWMMFTLIAVGLSGRELWGQGAGRQTSFIFIGCLGLLVSAHTLMPGVAGLCGLAIAFYGIALSQREWKRGGVLLGIGLSIGALSTGLIPFFIITLTCLMLPLIFPAWRNPRTLNSLLIAAGISTPILATWLLCCYHAYPDLLIDLFTTQLTSNTPGQLTYVLRTLSWVAWPALPFALWGAWRYRTLLLSELKFQLCLLFFFVTLVVIVWLGKHNEVYTLAFLIPLTAMATGSVDTLKRGASGALNWFGHILFGLINVIIWLGWAAMVTGKPLNLKNRLSELSGVSHLPLNIFFLLAASALTLIWLSTVLRTKHSNRSTVTNWAIGVTCSWTLLMTLWLPLLESAHTYQPVFKSLAGALPQQYACINSKNLGDAETDLLHYYANLTTYPVEITQQFNCDLLLIEDNRSLKDFSLDDQWQLIWSGQRASDKKEKFRLYQFAPNVSQTE